MTRYVRFMWQRGSYWGTHEGESVRRWSGPWYQGGVATQRTHSVDEVMFLPPVQPGKILAIGLNYAAHVAESASADAVPDEPVIFMKPPSALLSPGGAIVIPPQVDRVDYEGELGVVIGKFASQLPAEAAGEVIAGWTIGNDVTARNLQKKDKQWTRAKGFDTFCPIGPWVQDAFDRTASGLTTHLNGEVRQQSAFDRMVFSVEELIAFISRVMTLHPGDLILTGTPSGVGPISPGDTVSITVDGLGTLTNTVVTAISPPDRRTFARRLF